MDSSKDLKKALKNLPFHQPPENLWSKIESEIENEIQDVLLKQSLNELPVYEPSETVWENIVEELPNSSSNRFKVYRNYIGIAASFAVLLSAFWWVNQPNDGLNIEYAYSEEKLDERLQTESIPDDESAFAMIDEICAEKAYLCDYNDFNNLRNELNDLTSAKTELEEAISEFNTSTDLVAALNDIEMERTVVFKRLLAML